MHSNLATPLRRTVKDGPEVMELKKGFLSGTENTINKEIVYNR